MLDGRVGIPGGSEVIGQLGVRRTEHSVRRTGMADEPGVEGSGYAVTSLVTKVHPKKYGGIDRVQNMCLVPYNVVASITYAQPAWVAPCGTHGCGIHARWNSTTKATLGQIETLLRDPRL